VFIRLVETAMTAKNFINIYVKLYAEIYIFYVIQDFVSWNKIKKENNNNNVDIFVNFYNALLEL
jgi:hypothetical protein